jgi:hypothetical protein
VLGVHEVGPVLGRRFGRLGGALTAGLPLNPEPITTATCTRGPVAAATSAGIAAAVALPTMWARSAAAAAAPGR